MATATTSPDSFMIGLPLLPEDIGIVTWATWPWESERIDDVRTKESIYTLIANNKSATLDDKYYAIQKLLHKNHDVVRDFVEDSKKALHDELNAEFPSPKKISSICGKVEDLMQRLLDSFAQNQPYLNHISNSISKEYVNAVQNEFDADKALLGGNEYVAKQDKYWEELAMKSLKRAKEAEPFVERYNKVNAELSHLKMENNDISRQLDTEKQKTERLTWQLNDLNKVVERKDSIIKTIKMKLATMQNKLLTKGVAKELQQVIFQEESR